MRVVTNEQRIKRNRQIAQYLFFISLVILIGGLIITNTNIGRDNTLLAFAPCLVLPIGLITTWASVRLTNQYVREPHPEDAIQAGLKGASHHSILYNYLFKANHVLVCPQGVFAITTRFQNGPYLIKGDQWINRKSRGPMGLFMTLMRQEQIGKPAQEAQTAAADLQSYVDDALPGEGVTVQPVLVFTSDKAQFEVEQSAIPVVLANPKKKPSLKALVRGSKAKGDALLTPAQISKIEAELNSVLSIAGATDHVVAEDEA